MQAVLTFLGASHIYHTAQRYAANRQAAARGAGATLLALILWLGSFSAAAITLQNDQPYYALSNQMHWYADLDGTLTLEQIKTEQFLQQFTPNQDTHFNLGYVDHPVWFHVQLERKAAETPSIYDDAPWQLVIDYAPLDLIDIYLVHRDNRIKHLQRGDSLPFSQRQNNHHNFVVPLTIDEGQSVDVFLRVSSSSAVAMPLSIHSPQGSAGLNNGTNMFYGMYYGVMLIMLLYNLFIFFILKDRSYLYYVLHLISFLVLQASIAGHSFAYLWPNATDWNQISIPVLIHFACLCGLLFARDFLAIASYAPVANRLVIFSAALITISGILCFVIPYKLAMSTSIVFAIAGASLITVLAALSLLNGYQMARIFILGWSALLIGSSMHGLAVADILPSNTFILRGGLIGSVTEVVLLSMALADRFNLKIRRSESAAKESSEKLFKANQKLNAALDQQEHLNRAKDNFLGTISHELRTPMNGVEGALELMKTEDMPKKQKGYLDAAKQSARDMTAKIDGILRFSEMQSGELKIKREHFEIREALSQLISDARNKCMLKQLSFGFHVDRDVPSTIEGDGEQIIHVTKQLVENAINYTLEGQIQVYISKGWDELTQQDMLCISIIDTGTGIATEKMSNIFNAFEQLGGTTNLTQRGFGIGLTVCKQLVELMHGQLTIESTEGEGTELTFKLPLYIPADGALTNTTNASRIEFDPHRQQKTVLIAEDNPVNQMVLRGMLEKLGCVTITANNGAEACKLLESQPVDLILMDCQMPLMDGFEATQAIRNSRTAYSSVPIIAVTANAMSHDNSRCLDAGMNDYIKKPINREILETKVKRWLNSGKLVAL